MITSYMSTHGVRFNHWLLLLRAPALTPPSTISCSQFHPPFIPSVEREPSRPHRDGIRKWIGMNQWNWRQLQRYRGHLFNSAM